MFIFMCIPLMSECECSLCLRGSDKSYYFFVLFVFKNKISELAASLVLDVGRGPPGCCLKRNGSSD